MTNDEWITENEKRFAWELVQTLRFSPFNAKNKMKNDNEN